MSTPAFNDLEALARTIWGEARGEGAEGMAAVAEVIANRVKDGRWPDTFSAVCKQRRQFSCWNIGDPNREKLTNVALDDPAFQSAVQIAFETVQATDDLTHGANHYLTKSLYESDKRPSWADPSKVTATIGNHVFFRL